MATDWLSKDLWRAHVSWLTPPWVGLTEEGRKDFDAKRWLDQIQHAHYKTLIFYTKHHDGFCTFPSKYCKVQPERDFFGECVTEVRKRGMRILAYYSSVLDQLTGKEHPDWQVVGRDGTPQDGWFAKWWPGAYCCLNNPGCREMVIGQLTELRENYKPDGFWIDVCSPHTEENCFCQHCRAKYEKDADGGNLFDTKGNLWYQSCFVDLTREIRQIVKKDNPDCVLTFNVGLGIPGVDKSLDFLSQEAVTAPTISLMCRSLRSPDKPFECTYRLYTAVGSWAMKGPGRVLLESAAIVAHGGACSIELPPTHTGKILDEPVHRLTEVGAYIRETEPYLRDTEPVYDAAIFEPPQGGLPRAAGWSSVLTERDIPFAFVRPGEDFSPYRLLILDNVVTADELLAKQLARYVSEGGNLIVECGATQFGSPAGNILSEVLGITVMGTTGYPAHYLSVVDKRLASNLGEDDLIVEGQAHRIALATAKALAYYRYEFADRKPDRNILINLPPKATRSDDAAITLNHYGKGRAMYIACPLTTVEIQNHIHKWDDTREYPTQLAANLARFMIGEPLLRGTTPPGVEVVVNSSSGCHIVHLLNHYVCGQYHDNRRSILRLARVPVSINEMRIGHVRRAYRVCGTKEAELTIERDSKWIEVSVPELAVHDIVVFEH